MYEIGGKMIKPKVLTVFLVSWLLAACAQIPNTPATYSGSVAHLNDSIRKVSMIKWHFYELSMVDDRPIYASSACTYDGGANSQLGSDVCRGRHPVPAGKRIIHIRAVNYLSVPFFSLFNNIYKVEGDVLVTLEAGAEYFVQGELTQGDAAVWIEDATGELVSQKIEMR
jgi:hypothetical protein